MKSAAVRSGAPRRPAPSPVLDAARRLQDAIARERPPAGTLAEQLADADVLIASRWASAKVVSLDIFDTALVRVLQTPRDVFLCMPQLPTISALGLAPEAFAAARIAAEQDARRAALGAHGTGEVTLDEIATVLAQRLGHRIAPADLVQAERAVERAACRPQPWALALFERARASGKTTWFLSDTYHDAAFLRELLERAGFHGADLIVSSAEERRSKGAGALFGVILDRTGVRASDVLHIGDHPLSDGKRARDAGLHAVVHPLRASQESPQLSSSPASALALGVGRATARANERAADFWWRFGAETAGPVLAGFALWLAGRLHADRVEHAYFLLRDGEILSRVFEALTGGWTGLPSHSLLPSSRRAFALPAFEANAGSITSQLLVGVADKPLRTLFDRFGVPTDGLDAAIARHGLGSLDRLVRVTHPTHLQQLAQFLGDPDVRTRFAATSRKERALLVAFLDQAGMFGRRVALVDIGWNGTIQKALQKVARLEGRPLDVRGYYLGTRAGIDSSDEPNMRTAGYLCDRDLPASRGDGLRRCREVVEFVCSSARGSLLGFRETNGRVEAIEAAPEHVGPQGEALTAVHDGVMAYVAALRTALAQFGVFDLPADAVAAPLMRVLSAPTTEEAATIGGIRHGEGVGTSAAQSIAAWPEDATTLDDLEIAWSRAYWPDGLLALPDPRSLLVHLSLWQRKRAAQ